MATEGVTQRATPRTGQQEAAMQRRRPRETRAGPGAAAAAAASEAGATAGPRMCRPLRTKPQLRPPPLPLQSPSLRGSGEGPGSAAVGTRPLQWVAPQQKDLGGVREGACVQTWGRHGTARVARPRRRALAGARQQPAREEAQQPQQEQTLQLRGLQGHLRERGVARPRLAPLLGRGQSQRDLAWSVASQGPAVLGNPLKTAIQRQDSAQKLPRPELEQMLILPQ